VNTEFNPVTLNFQEFGSARETCILLHGFGDGAYVWNAFTPSISSFFRTIAVDLRGHGDSPWDPTGEYGIRQHVTDVLQIIDVAQPGRFVLVGHSLGGEIALRIAAACAGRVIGCVLVDFGPDTNREGGTRIIADFNDSARVWHSLFQYELWLRERRPLMHPSMVATVAFGALRRRPDGTFQLKCDPAIGRQKLRECHDNFVLWEMLKSFPFPVLVIRGVGSSVLSRAVAKRMEKILLNPHLRMIPNAGHAVMTDNPEAFADALHPFLLETLHWAKTRINNYERLN
jgi:pimeloyl-ACP methyl ester carboxylesterase